jgi:hypothetical protein
MLLHSQISYIQEFTVASALAFPDLSYLRRTFHTTTAAPSHSPPTWKQSFSFDTLPLLFSAIASVRDLTLKVPMSLAF